MTAQPRVLLVDYDPKALRTLGDLFTANGYQVDTAKDGALALSMFQKLKPSIVVLEAMIPKKHGFEVCQEIKKSPEGRTTPVIIMTAVYKGRKYRSQAMHVHGCDEYVEKPCAPEALLEIVKRFVPPGEVPVTAGAGAARASTGVGAAHASGNARGSAVTSAATSSFASGGSGASRGAGGTGSDRQGEVIQFPPVWADAPKDEFELEMERAIMSKLDDILPDTPIFNERGLGAPLAPTVAVAPPPPLIEAEAAPPPAAKRVEAVAAAPTLTFETAPPREDSSKKSAKRGKGAQSTSAESVGKMVKPAAAAAMTADAAERKKRRLISPLFVVGFFVALVITVAIYLLGHI